MNYIEPKFSLYPGPIICTLLEGVVGSSLTLSLFSSAFGGRIFTIVMGSDDRCRPSRIDSHNNVGGV